MVSKLIITFTILIAVIFTYSPQVQAFESADTICAYIAKDDKKRLRKLLRSKKLAIRKLYKDVTCNNASLLQFALEREATNVGLFMVKKIKVSQLKKRGILAWAKEKGFSDTEISKAISKRIGAD